MVLDYNTTVLKKEILSPRLVILKIFPDWPIPDFKPGQFTTLGLNAKEESEAEGSSAGHGIIRKAYSISSSPLEKDHLEFYIASVPSGQLSPSLIELNPGDRLHVGPKIVGHFTLEGSDPSKNYLFVGTGTGLAPYISMLRTHLPDLKTKIILLHGATHSSELGYLAELSQYEKTYPNFTYWPTLSRFNEEKDWQGSRQRVTTILEEGMIEQKTQLKLSPELFNIYLCGNPQMIDDALLFLTAQGFHIHHPKGQGQIFVEKY